MSATQIIPSTGVSFVDLFVPAPESTGNLEECISDNFRDWIYSINTFKDAYLPFKESLTNLSGSNQSTKWVITGILEDLSVYFFPYLQKGYKENDILAAISNQDIDIKMKPKDEFKIRITIKSVLKAKPKVCNLEEFGE